MSVCVGGVWLKVEFVFGSVYVHYTFQCKLLRVLRLVIGDW